MNVRNKFTSVLIYIGVMPERIFNSILSYISITLMRKGMKQWESISEKNNAALIIKVQMAAFACSHYTQVVLSVSLLVKQIIKLIEFWRQNDLCSSVQLSAFRS